MLLLERRKRLIFASFTLGFIFFFFTWPKVAKFVFERQKTESIGIVGRFTLENLPYEIQKLISLGLTQLEKDGTPAPGLAKKWEINEGGKTYTFYLEENLFWHDGSEIKADQINYNFKDVAVSVLDPKTIRFTLKEPFSPFPVIVSRPVFKKGLIGAGPYKVKKITRSGQFIESISLQALKNSSSDLKYRFYPTEAAAKTGLKLGEVRILENILNPEGFEDFRNIKITPQIREDHYVAIFLNTNNSLLAEKNFRQALAYAIPKDPEKKRILGSFSPHSWAYNPDLKPYEYNLEKAKTLLKKAFEEEKEISLKLSVVSSLLGEGEKVKDAWEELGVKTALQVISSPEEEFEALLAIQEIPSDPDQYSFWHSSQERTNITHLKNPRIDKLLEDGRKTQDRQERKKIYFDFQRFLVEEVPAIFLYHPTLYQISRK